MYEMLKKILQGLQRFTEGKFSTHKKMQQKGSQRRQPDRFKHTCTRTHTHTKQSENDPFLKTVEGG